MFLKASDDERTHVYSFLTLPEAMAAFQTCRQLFQSASRGVREPIRHLERHVKLGGGTTNVASMEKAAQPWRTYVARHFTSFRISTITYDAILFLGTDAPWQALLPITPHLKTLNLHFELGMGSGFTTPLSLGWRDLLPAMSQTLRVLNVVAPGFILSTLLKDLPQLEALEALQISRELTIGLPVIVAHSLQLAPLLECARLVCLELDEVLETEEQALCLPATLADVRISYSRVFPSPEACQVLSGPTVALTSIRFYGTYLPEYMVKSWPVIEIPPHASNQDLAVWMQSKDLTCLEWPLWSLSSSKEEKAEVQAVNPLHLKKLRHLHAKGMGLPNDGLPGDVARMTSLTSLSMTHIDLKGGMLKRILQSIPLLQVLQLVGCYITSLLEVNGATAPNLHTFKLAGYGKNSCAELSTLWFPHGPPLLSDLQLDLKYFAPSDLPQQWGIRFLLAMPHNSTSTRPFLFFFPREQGHAGIMSTTTVFCFPHPFPRATHAGMRRHCVDVDPIRNIKKTTLIRQ